MTDPQKLVLTTRTELGRALLRSAEGDHSAPGAAQRALLALSVGTGVAMASGASSAAAASSTASKWAGALMLKWLGVGLLAGTTALVSLDYATRPRAAPTAPSTAPREQPQRARESTATSGNPASSEAEPPSAPLTAPVEVRHVPGAAPPLVHPDQEHAPSSDSSAAALAALQAVRAALAAHAPERALALLASFEQRDGAAAFAEEASVLRIRALADAGRSADAAALASDFLKRYPHSAYAERVRSKVQQP